MKHFTKLGMIIALAVIIGFSFAACDIASLAEDAGDDGDSGSSGGSSVVLENTSWSGSIEGVSYEFDFYSGGSGYIYASDGYNSEGGSFTWSLSGSRVTIRIDGEVFATGTVSGTTMRLTAGGDTMTLRKDSGSSGGGNDGGNSGGSVDLSYTTWAGMGGDLAYAFYFYPGGTGDLAIIAPNYETEEGSFTWTLSGNNVVIRYQTMTLRGTVSGSTMRVSDPGGNTMTLTKQ